MARSSVQHLAKRRRLRLQQGSEVRMRRLAAFGLFCVLATQSSAQQTPSQEGVIRINVTLVQVDAVVTDARGKPVTNLTADDFEVFQDGKTQTITNFAFVDVR